jgi:hypothetical protein
LMKYKLLNCDRKRRCTSCKSLSNIPPVNALLAEWWSLSKV